MLSWYIPVDILTIVISLLTIILALSFILITIFNRTLRNLANVLSSHTCLSIAFFSLTITLIAVHQYQCDTTDVADNMVCNDSLCVIRSYLNTVGTVWALYSFLIQAIHRCLTVVYSSKLFLKTYRFYFLMVLIQFLIVLFFPCPFHFIISTLQYDPDSYVCVTTDTRNSKDVPTVIINIYRQLISFVIPIVTICFTYLKLVLYVRNINRQSIAVSLVQRARYELSMMLRIIIILIIMAVGSIIGMIFGFMNTPPIYRWRIYYLSLVTSAFLCMIAFFLLTTSIKQILLRWCDTTFIHMNRIRPIATHLSTFRHVQNTIPTVNNNNNNTNNNNNYDRIRF